MSNLTISYISDMPVQPSSNKLYFLYSIFNLIVILKGLNLYLYFNNRLGFKMNMMSLYLSLPSVIAALMLISNSSTNYLFIIKNNEFSYGMLFPMIYSTYYLYTAHIIVRAIKKNMKFVRFTKIFIGFFGLYLICLPLVLFNTVDLHPLHLLSSMLLLIIYMMLEVPMLQEDKDTGLLNRNSFDNYIETLDVDEAKIILIKIKNLEILRTFETKYKLNNAYHYIIEAAKKEFHNSYYFNVTQSIVGVTFLENIETERFISFINSKLNELKQMDKSASPTSFTFAVTDSLQLFNDTDSLYNAIIDGIDELDELKISNKYIQLTQSTSDKYVRKQKIYKKLHYAISQHQIELRIQPIYNVKEKTILSGEVLSRLQIPGIGYVPSFEFITMAEKNGSINEFGIAVISELCHYLNAVQLPITQLSFNISMFHCMQPTLPDVLLKIVKENNIDPKLLTIEITETSEVLDWDILKTNMRRLKEKGFTLSLDDFGTGFASLEYFMSLPFDIIKFDRNLLLEAEKSKTSMIALASTIKMVKSLGHTTVLEGVETENQNRIAHEVEVDYIQGFLYGRPMNLSDFTKIVNK
ncbi:MAG: EAL domain-containing protein [Sphaerochaetaceae bacterium]